MQTRTGRIRSTSPLAAPIAALIAINVIAAHTTAGSAAAQPSSTPTSAPGAASADAAVTAKRLAGLWHASVTVNGVEIPFRFELAPARGTKSGEKSGKGDSLSGSFFDGDRKVSSTRGTIADQTITLAFDQYLATLEATVADDTLSGRYARGKIAYPFKATRAATSGTASTAAAAPQIAGVWTIPTQSPKGESAWRFIVRQKDAQVSAAILRVDGDTGTLTGTWKDGKYVLSHFSGARPLLLEVTPAADGTLDILQNGKTKLTAIKAEVAAARNVAPTDPAHHTTITNPGERFEFSLPDLDGRLVTAADPRFEGKVLIISITGSWCPNCHDEAPFLAQLARTYRKKGLEVVAFSFEEEEQLQNPTRLKAFIAEYGIDYTVLLAGEPAQLAAKVPQVANLNSFPTTLFVGRDGRLRATHAGFPSPASGAFYKQAQKDITAQVERLLAERPARATAGTQ